MQGGTRDTGDPDDVHVEHAMPLVVVGSDGARRAGVPARLTTMSMPPS